MKTSKEVHQRLFAIEYQLSEPPIDSPIGSLAVQLTRNVVSTAKKHLLRSRYTYHGAEPSKADEEFEVPIIVCTVPGSEADLPEDDVSFFLLNRAVIDPERVPRTRTIHVAKLCVMSVKAILMDTEFYQRQENGGIILSGPRPLQTHALREHIRGLDVFNNAPPTSAEQYTLDLANICDNIFAQVTGGSIPRITCEISYGTPVSEAG